MLEWKLATNCKRCISAVSNIFKALFRLIVRFMFSAQYFLFVLQTHRSGLKTSHAPTRSQTMTVELCSALGTEDETLILGIARCCSEFERQSTKHPICWTFYSSITPYCTYHLMKLGFVCFSVRTLSGDHTDGPVHCEVPSKGTAPQSASFNVSVSVQRISVWVEAQNLLGSTVSVTINYTLSDIGKTAAVSQLGEFGRCLAACA